MKIPKNKTQIPQTVVSWRRSPGIMYHFFLFSSSLSPSHVIHVIIIALFVRLITAITFSQANIVGSTELGWLDPELVIGPRRSMKCVRNGTNGNIVQIKRLLKHFSSALLSRAAFPPTAPAKSACRPIKSNWLLQPVRWCKVNNALIMSVVDGEERNAP